MKIVNSLFLLMMLSSCTFTACVKPVDLIDSKEKEIEVVKA